MKLRFAYFIIVSGLFGGFVNAQILSKEVQVKTPKRYPLNNDSTAIYSTHPSRPYRYGYAYSEKQCKDYFEYLISDFNIKKGDVVADVGAASGWLEGVLSVLTDSVTFYIQDINKVFLNDEQLEKVIEYYSSVRKKPQTNKFHLVIGDKTHTNLPQGHFDKVIFNNSFHEMVFPDKIIADVITKLKPNGEIIVSEGFSNEYKKHNLAGCKIRGYRVHDLIEMFRRHGFYLQRMIEPFHSFSNCLVFGTDINKSSDFYNFLEDTLVEKYLSELDRLNFFRVANDSLTVNQIALCLKDHLTLIESKYRTIGNYLYYLGAQWTHEKHYKAAKNIFDAGLLIYPGSSSFYTGLGELFLKRKRYELALKYFTRAVESDQENKYIQSKINYLRIKLKKRRS